MVQSEKGVFPKNELSDVRNLPTQLLQAHSLYLKARDREALQLLKTIEPTIDQLTLKTYEEKLYFRLSTHIYIRQNHIQEARRMISAYENDLSINQNDILFEIYEAQALLFIRTRDKNSLYIAIDKIRLINFTERSIFQARFNFIVAEGKYLEQKYVEAIDLMEQAINIFNENNYLRSAAYSYIKLAIYKRMKGNCVHAIEALSEGKRIFETINDAYGAARCMIFIGTNYNILWEEKMAETYLLKSFEYFSNNKYPTETVVCVINLINLYRQGNDLNRAQEYARIAWDQSEHVNDKNVMGALTNSMGLVYKDLNLLDEAEFYLLLGYKYNQELGFDRRVSDVANNLYTVYHEKGDLKKAYKFLKESFELTKAENNELLLIDSHHNFAKLYHAMGNYGKAKLSINTAAKISENHNNIPMLTHNLILYVDILRSSGDMDGIPSILDRLDELVDQIESPVRKLSYLLAKANYLDALGTPRAKFEALEIYREIFASQDVDTLLLIKALPKYCYLLILELRITKDPRTIQELEGYIEKLIDIALLEQSKLLHVQSLILLSQIDLLKYDVQNSLKKLDYALILSEENGLISYLHDIQQIKYDIQNTQKIWSQIKTPGLVDDQSMDIVNLESTISIINEKYQLIMHPIRYSILRLLNYYTVLTRTKLIDWLNIPSSGFERHLKKMVDGNLVSTKIDLIDSRAQKIVEITIEGLEVYRRFKEIVV